MARQQDLTLMFELRTIPECDRYLTITIIDHDHVILALSSSFAIDSLLDIAFPFSMYLYLQL
jgi:hypothetical protein